MSGLLDQHLEIGADHLVAIELARAIVAAGFGVLANLAEDPRIGGRGAADHHCVASRLCDHGYRVFGRADIAVADYRDTNRVFHRGNPVPARVDAVSLLARAGM